MIPIAKLHYLTQDLENKSHTELAEAVCAAGIGWLQLRVKAKPYQEWLSIAKEVKKITDYYKTVLIVNDNVEIALEIKAHGVHLGKKDMPVGDARKLLGIAAIIGGTANNMEDMKTLSRQPVDYIGLGPFCYTATKEQLAPVLGLSGMAEIVQQTTKVQIPKSIPIIAIGGITLADVSVILQAGFYGVAVSSAINLAENTGITAKNFLNTVTNFDSNLQS